MSSLEDMMSQQKDLMNRGYQIDQIQCAAMMLIAERMVVLTTPIVTQEPMPKIGPLPELELETTEEMIERELGESDGDN